MTSVFVSSGHNDECKKIIRGVTGTFKSGELTAIMGPSGAGKTSLLNILTGYQKSGVEGVIKCKNGKKTKTGSSQYKNDSCYILQDDHLIAYFTVYEIMYSTTQLKISEQSKEKNDLLIDSILTTLGLEKTKNIRCGNLSGGQRKRLSIALELIDDPPILFLDEPTTGLDSSSSNQCVQMLKTLAERGRTIVCTIHQPSASMYHLFSHVYIMAKGKCVYQGAPENTVPYLALHGYICPKYHNPADFLLEVTSDASTQDIDKFAIAATETNWRSSINSENDKVSEKEVDIKRQSDSYDYPDVDRSKRPQSQWKVFKVLLKKQFIHQYRDWTVAKLKLVVHFLVGIFLGVTFQNCGNDASKTLQNFSFFITGVVYLCYTSLMPAALRFPQELKIIKKEHFNRWYKLRTFYAAFLAADLPMQVLLAVSYTTSAYVATSQPLEFRRFFMVLLIHSLIGLVASGMGIMFGSLVNPVNGTFIGAISTVTMLSVAGFLCFFPHMNTVFYYASNLSYFSFSMEGLLQAVYGYNREKLVCPEDEIFCLYTSPKQFLTELGMDKLPYWVDVGWITGYFILFRLLAYYSLKFRLKHL
ncbi:ATP-binding cassette sub-family G member 1 isoform X3 [Dendroctonus ponderosae]|uniref:ATP-binding cassette sub-family G member 1 isoform X3 n=1 Tax=Dendroctonus ponderosae TaxID=77166 RepID=UPI002035BD53|nr:ATP-binding cassette sub-family G member 1 isoform X3 [Dendroctonus ponderosae]